MRTPRWEVVQEGDELRLERRRMRLLDHKVAIGYLICLNLLLAAAIAVRWGVTLPFYVVVVVVGLLLPFMSLIRGGVLGRRLALGRSPRSITIRASASTEGYRERGRVTVIDVDGHETEAADAEAFLCEFSSPLEGRGRAMRALILVVQGRWIHVEHSRDLATMRRLELLFRKSLHLGRNTQRAHVSEGCLTLAMSVLFSVAQIGAGIAVFTWVAMDLSKAPWPTTIAATALLLTLELAGAALYTVTEWRSGRVQLQRVVLDRKSR